MPSVSMPDASIRLVKKSVVFLQESSFGPILGIKGDTAGISCALIIPMEDIKLHFTGNFNVVYSANNLLKAMLYSCIF
ncbi:MAG: formate--tetrahydrofolate ligase [Eggerthellaceae bacterium]|nr:formate--tetrahydrofolate ligase [Eggerthellaceae bacterium]